MAGLSSYKNNKTIWEFFQVSLLVLF